ncbi:hypothetical protein Fot_03508 [Forsythia ovata]|uniref:Uncharacterized protein n=1 Tax=Forsythia ovata TaxID=205694 RepID=A0ABD1XA24_9LAMI
MEDLITEIDQSSKARKLSIRAYRPYVPTLTTKVITASESGCSRERSTEAEYLHQLRQSRTVREIQTLWRLLYWRAINEHRNYAQDAMDPPMTRLLVYREMLSKIRKGVFRPFCVLKITRK